MYATALIIGFLGSVHCLGMCGPIALAIPVPAGKRMLGFVVYHMGRILIYSLMGMVFGLLGFSLMVGGLQQILTISIGLFFLVILVLPAVSNRLLAKYNQSSWMRWVKQKTVNQFQKRTFTATFIAGMLNGFIPCGLIYMAIGGTFLTTNFMEAGLYMALFGLGTIPALASFWMMPVISKFRSSYLVRRAVPVFGMVLALLFIYRGVSFSIPEIDPYLGAIGFEKISICR